MGFGVDRGTSSSRPPAQAYLGDATPEQCGTPYMRLQREGFRGGQLLTGSGALSRAEEDDYQRECDVSGSGSQKRVSETDN